MEEFGSIRAAKDLVAEAESRIRSVSPHEAIDEVTSGRALLVNVREPEEWREGHVPAATNIPHGWLELKMDPESSSFDPRIHPDKPL